MENKIKIHLADDHQVLIDGILAVLKTNSDFEVVGFSLNGEGLVDRVARNKADILIMDINMPEKDGIQVLREMNEVGFTCKVIILSSYDDAKLIKEVIKLGASGYLTKQCAGENIIDAITTVAFGNQYFSDTIKNKIFRKYYDFLDTTCCIFNYLGFPPDTYCLTKTLQHEQNSLFFRAVAIAFIGAVSSFQWLLTI